MSPFNLTSVKKSLKKIDRKRTDSSYSLKPFVEKWIQDHPPKLSYTFKQPKIPFDEWKQQIHDLIFQKVNVLEPLPLNENKIEFHGEAEANKIKFIKFSLMALPGLRVPAILCIPNDATSKTPTCICVHGHNMSKDTSVGLKKSKSKEYFGYELAVRGLITLSLDWIGMGERERFINRSFLFFQNEGPRSNWVRFLGLDMIGLRITEIKGLMNYLETREEIDSKRLGIVGHSGGGAICLFTTILDKRIKVCAVSGYFGTWEHSILSMHHCGCNYSGELRKYVELYDIFASLAPLPVAVTMGKKDKIFPIEGVEIALPIIQKAYYESKHPDNFLIDLQTKGHKFYGDKVYPFILNHI
ncbi:MAG: alpha/beta hydrolase family protein [Candidatus Hodarchaeota archaeon]